MILDGLNLPESHEEIVTEIADVEVMIHDSTITKWTIRELIPGTA